MFNGFREHKVTPDRAPSIPTPTPPEAGGAGKNLMDGTQGSLADSATLGLVTLPRWGKREICLLWAGVAPCFIGNTGGAGRRDESV